MSMCLLLALWQPATMHRAEGGEAPERAHELWIEGAGLHLEKKYEQAIARYRESIALQPRARTYTYLGWSLSELGRYEDAIDQVREAIALDPEYPNAYNDLGSYLIELRQPAEAVPYLEKAVSLPDYCCPHYSYYHIGRARLMQGKIEAAREALRQSISVNPRYRPPHELLQRIRDGGMKVL